MEKGRKERCQVGVCNFNLNFVRHRHNQVDDAVVEIYSDNPSLSRQTEIKLEDQFG